MKKLNKETISLYTVILLILIVFLLLTSCGYNAADFRNNIVIVEIQQYHYNDPEYKGCWYFTRTIVNTRIDDRAYFFDKCGKFTVGDTVGTILKNKHKPGSN